MKWQRRCYTLCDRDAQTVRAEDLVVHQSADSACTENYLLSSSARQVWYFFPKMTSEANIRTLRPMRGGPTEAQKLTI